MTGRIHTLVGLIALAPLAALTAACRETAAPVAPPTTTGDRSAHVSEHAAEVMPFDTDRATHTFAPGDHGLVETVTADDPVDPTQVDLIRTHLAAEAHNFANGDFDDPAKIHGDDMPGLATLRAAGTRLTVAYADVPAGGRISYTSTDPVVVDALHRYAAVQSMDHAHH